MLKEEPEDKFATGDGYYLTSENIIGKGTFGKIYKAECKKDEEKEALVKTVCVIDKTKVVIKRVVTTSDEEYKNVEQEIDIHKKLMGEDAHNIAKIIYSTETDKTFYIVIEYIEHNLFIFLFNNHFRNLSDSNKNSIYCELYDGVKYINERGIIHNDIKPENIMIMFNIKSKLWSPKYIDFGASKYNSTTITKENNSGTISYFSPEIKISRFLNEQGRKVPEINYGPETDIWALGCVFNIISFNSINDHDYKDKYYRTKNFKQDCMNLLQVDEDTFNEEFGEKEYMDWILYLDPMCQLFLRDQIILENANNGLFNIGNIPIYLINGFLHYDKSKRIKFFYDYYPEPILKDIRSNIDPDLINVTNVHVVDYINSINNKLRITDLENIENIEDIRSDMERRLKEERLMPTFFKDKDDKRHRGIILKKLLLSRPILSIYKSIKKSTRKQGGRKTLHKKRKFIRQLKQKKNKSTKSKKNKSTKSKKREKQLNIYTKRKK